MKSQSKNMEIVVQHLNDNWHLHHTDYWVNFENILETSYEIQFDGDGIEMKNVILLASTGGIRVWYDSKNSVVVASLGHDKTRYYIADGENQAIIGHYRDIFQQELTFFYKKIRRG